MILSLTNIENLPREELLSIIDQLSKQNISLTLKVEELTQNVEEFSQIVEELTKKLAHYQHPKNSGNSSILPSKTQSKFERKKRYKARRTRRA